MMSNIHNCLINRDTKYNPIWFMRQAGRYLPEFRKIRQLNKDFTKLCLNKDLSSEITLQPMKRFDLDAAIIFSDILLIPHVLGQTVNFFNGQGPSLKTFDMDIFESNNLEILEKKLSPVYSSLNLTRKKLDKKKSLISFVGAPWTLLVYMFDFKKDKKNHKEIDKIESKYNLKKVIDDLVKYLCFHIEKQVRSGSDIVQIFDSWAGLIPENKLIDFCFEPNKKIVNYCKKLKVPSICFPKGIGKNYSDFVKIVKPEGINIDYTMNPDWAKKNLQNVCIQGGMDPKILLGDEKGVLNEVDKYLSTFKDTPYIFNLGHGILPQTNPSIIEKVIKKVRSYKS